MGLFVFHALQLALNSVDCMTFLEFCFLVFLKKKNWKLKDTEKGKENGSLALSASGNFAWKIILPFLSGFKCVVVVCAHG